MTLLILSPGQAIRRWRDEIGWTQAALAQKVGVSQQAIDLLERDRRFPSPTTLAEIEATTRLRLTFVAANGETRPGDPLYQLPRTQRMAAAEVIALHSDDLPAIITLCRRLNTSRTRPSFWRRLFGWKA